MAKKVIKKRRAREPKEFAEEVLEIARVTRVVKGGRRLRFRATVIVGNRKGKVGLGIGKSVEVAGAVQKAVSQAKKNLINVTLTEISSIPHEVRLKFKASQILIMPAFDGTGIIAGGAVRKIAELAGIKNLMGKSFGTTNKLVNAQATMLALQKLRVVPKKVSEKKDVSKNKETEKKIVKKEDNKADK